jgi:hypothetical protein
MERRGYPHPGWFLAKSAEAIENKGVEISGGAKDCGSNRKQRR